jgi:hypothetical protein
MIFFQIFYGVWCNVKKPKTKPPQIQQDSPATTNPTKVNHLLHQPPPTTTNPTKTNHRPPPTNHKLAKSHHKFNKKNHQTHHQPPQTHKKTINPQIITTYNHNKTHSIKTKNNQTTLFKTHKTHKPLQSRVHREDSHKKAPQRQGVRRRDQRWVRRPDQRWLRRPDRRWLRLDRRPNQVRERRDEGGIVREIFEGWGGLLYERFLRGGGSERDEGGGGFQ